MKPESNFEDKWLSAVYELDSLRDCPVLVEANQFAIANKYMNRIIDTIQLIPTDIEVFDASILISWEKEDNFAYMEVFAKTIEFYIDSKGVKSVFYVSNFDDENTSLYLINVLLLKFFKIGM